MGTSKADWPEARLSKLSPRTLILAPILFISSESYALPTWASQSEIEIKVDTMLNNNTLETIFINFNFNLRGNWNQRYVLSNNSAKKHSECLSGNYQNNLKKSQEVMEHKLLKYNKLISNTLRK